MGHEKPTTTVARGDLGHIEDAVFTGGIAGHISQDIAQDFAAQSIQSFGHERAAGIGAGLDLVSRNFHFTRQGAQQDGRIVLAGDDPGQELTVGGLDIPSVEAWIDFAIRIDDVHQQFFRTVSTHAGQGRADFPSFVAEFVTGRAADGKHRFAIGQIAGLGNDRGQRRDNFIFRFLVGIQLIFHGGGPGGHFTSGVSAQAVGIGRPECRGLNGPSLHAIEENHRPISALEQRFKGGGPRFDRQLAVGGSQHRTDSGISRFTQSHDQALLKTRRIVCQQLAFQSRHDRGTGRANAQQAAGGAHPNRFFRRGIAECARQLLSNPVDDASKVTASRIPLGR